MILTLNKLLHKSSLRILCQPYLSINYVLFIMVFSALGPNLLGASPSRNPASSATNNDTSVDESRELEKQCVIIICEKEVNKCRHLRTTTTAMTRVMK